MQKLKEQILLGSDSLDGVRETGGFGQPLHALYPQIRAVLAGELGQEAAELLAEPVVDRASNRIDWYSEGDPDVPPVALSSLAEELRRPIMARIEELLGRGRELAEQYAASNDPRRMQLSALLKAVLNTPAATEVFLVDQRPLITRWGFAPDRPWEALAGSTAHRPSAVAPNAPRVPPGDVVVPEMPVPELETAPPPLPVAETSSPAAGQDAPPSSSTPPPDAQQEPSSSAAQPDARQEPSPPPPPAPHAERETVMPPPASPAAAMAPPPAEPDPGDAERISPAAPAPVSSLRYVVVGSSYFWGVVGLALVLLLVAFFWRQSHKPASAMPEAPLRSTADAPLDPALVQAQRSEAELRTRLEALLVQLASRRGQCPVPDRTHAGAPAQREPGDSRSFASRSAVAVTGGGSPGSQKPVTAAPEPKQAPVAAEKPGTPLAAEKPGTDPAPAGADATNTRSSASQQAEPASVRPAAPAGESADRVASAGTALAPSRTPSTAQQPAPTLEEALTTPNTPSPVQQSPSRPAVEPPVKAEPTAEERQEFKDRLSAAGAATGETTATLLWNTHGDLDLVVRCPSGQQLDYQHPSECGGTLDVDANAARTSLSTRPVENAYWPAGKAQAGQYEIAVRYVPRKDEQNPQATPFQVRLVRGGRETVFKGVVQPHASVPVTVFTVER